MNRVIPNFTWYSTESTRLGLKSPRCPFASVHACPRYYQSLSLLGGAGCTAIPKAEDDALKANWEKHPLWPATEEQATSISGGDGEKNSYSKFCPEVAYDTFGLFATFLGQHIGELDRELAAARLSEEGADHNDPGWTWAFVTPQHYSACPLYSPLSQGIDKVQPVPLSRPESPKSVGAMKPRPKRTSASKKAKSKRFVFISYAHADTKWLDKLQRHLKPLLHGTKVQAWSDKKIQTGDRWSKKIQEALTHANAAVLLVSAHFLASDYIRHFELPRILKKEKRRGLRIFQIILSPCAFIESKFEYKDSRGRKKVIKLADFQAATSPSKTLQDMKSVERERVLLQFAKEISSLDKTPRRKTPEGKKATRTKRAPTRTQSSHPAAKHTVHEAAQSVDQQAIAPNTTKGLLSVVLQPFQAARAKALAIRCTNNLKEVGLALRMWANAHGDCLPRDFISMKGEFHDMRITSCPADKSQYTISSDGRPCPIPSVVFALCPYHKHALLVDGTVQSFSNRRLIRQGGRLLIQEDGS